MRRIVVISDIQCPYENSRCVSSIARYIRATAPDLVMAVGDVLDAPQVSRWTKSARGEFASTLGRDRDHAVRVLEELQVTHLQRSNHDERYTKYLEQYAPAVAGLPELTLTKFLKLDSLGIELHAKPWEFHPGWYMMHGDEGGIRSDGAMTALGLAKKIGASVVCGHTHRLGVAHDTDSVNGKIMRIKTGFEVGTLMQMSRADYITKQAGAANWQLGFGYIEIHGDIVQCTPVAMQPNGSFVLHGRVWK